MARKSAVALYLAKLGAKGGKATSEAKSEAARLNGKKGGRPPKKDQAAPRVR